MITRNYIEELDNICKIEISGKTEHIIRNKISQLTESIHRQVENVCRSSELEELKTAQRECLLILKKLQNTILLERDSSSLVPQKYNLNSFLYDLCSAADIVLCSRGCRIRADISDVPLYVTFEISSLQTAIYNILASIAQHIKYRSEIRISIEENLSEISIRFSATVKDTRNMSNIFHSISMTAASHAAKIHRGSLFYGTANGKLCCALNISKHLNAIDESTVIVPPDFADLMCNRLSPMYIGMSNICSTPV